MARIALLTPGPETHRLVLGIPLAVHQVRFCKTLACDRILVMGTTMAPALAAMQAESDRAAIPLRTVADAGSLPACVTAQDVLVIFHPALFLDEVEELGDATRQAMVAVLPADAADGQMMERLSAAHRWAGLAVVPGRQAQALADLSPDADATSALIRSGIAGGARTDTDVLQPRSRLPGTWRLIASDADAAAAGREFTLLRLGERPVTPGAALARWIAMLAVARDVAPGRLLRVMLITAVALALLAGAVIAAGLTFVAPLALGLAWLSGRSGAVASQLDGNSAPWDRRLDDAVLALLALVALRALWPDLQPAAAVFLALGSFGWMALASRYPARAARWWSDGLLQGALLTASLFMGLADIVLAPLGLLAMGFVFLTLRSQRS